MPIGGSVRILIGVTGIIPYKRQAFLPSKTQEEQHVSLLRSESPTILATDDPVCTISNTEINSRSITDQADPVGECAGIVDEKTFIRMLCLERKRTERSKRRFMLMLLENDKLLAANANRLLFQTFSDNLSRAIRETDAAGWYKSGSVLGVIFTELGDEDAKLIRKLLHDKVTKVLSESLRVEAVNQTRLAFHLYPEDTTVYDSGALLDLTLYPEQTSDDDPKKMARFTKRSIDLLGCYLALLFLCPLLAVIALAIKLSSPGPILFRQQRVGLQGATFSFLKFRSMYLANDEMIHKEYVTRFISGDPEFDGANGMSYPIFKIQKDPRITTVGRLLRRTSLDELPQFLNVLRGEMSLVGPRPPIPYEFACYQPWHKRRLIMKPGITGLWQVSGRSKVKFNEMVRLDLKYTKSWSLRLDLKILMKTPAAVLSGEGAY